MELASRILSELESVATDARETVVQREAFLRLVEYVETLGLLVENVNARHVKEIPDVIFALKEIDAKLQDVRRVVDRSRASSKIALFLSSTELVEEIEKVVQDLGEAALKMPFAQMGDIPKEVSGRIKTTCRSMRTAEFRPTFLGSRTCEMIEKGLAEANDDVNLVRDLFVCVSRGIGFDKDFPRMRQELQLFREEKNAKRQVDPSAVKRLDEIDEMLQQGEKHWRVKLGEVSIMVDLPSPAGANNTMDQGGRSEWPLLVRGRDVGGGGRMGQVRPQGGGGEVAGANADANGLQFPKGAGCIPGYGDAKQPLFPGALNKAEPQLDEVGPNGAAPILDKGPDGTPLPRPLAAHPELSSEGVVRNGEGNPVAVIGSLHTTQGAVLGVEEGSRRRPGPGAAPLQEPGGEEAGIDPPAGKRMVEAGRPSPIYVPFRPTIDVSPVRPAQQSGRDLGASDVGGGRPVEGIPNAGGGNRQPGIDSSRDAGSSVAQSVPPVEQAGAADHGRGGGSNDARSPMQSPHVGAGHGPLYRGRGGHGGRLGVSDQSAPSTEGSEGGGGPSSRGGMEQECQSMAAGALANGVLDRRKVRGRLDGWPGGLGFELVTIGMVLPKDKHDVWLADGGPPSSQEVDESGGGDGGGGGGAPGRVGRGVSAEPQRVGDAARDRGRTAAVTGSLNRGFQGSAYDSGQGRGEPSGVQADLSARDRSHDNRSQMRPTGAALTDSGQTNASMSQKSPPNSVSGWASESQSSKISIPIQAAGGRQLDGVPSIFVCPILRDLMRDPVLLLASGVTFERRAIEGWIRAGNKTCPATSVELRSLELEPDESLRLNFISWTSQLLSSEKDEDHSKGLTVIYLWCVDSYNNKELITHEGSLVLICALLRSNNRKIRRKSMALLHCIAQDAEGRREKVIASESLPSIVRSLSRDIREARQGVALLLELTHTKAAAEELGRTQGAILLLATLSSNTDAEAAAKDAIAVLQRLGQYDANVVKMAEAGVFEPLIRRLKAGTDHDRETILEEVCGMRLTDQSKIQLVERGMLPILSEILSSPSMALKNAVIRLLYSLSSVDANAVCIADAGLLPAILAALCRNSPALAPLKELLSSLLVNLVSALRKRKVVGLGPVRGAHGERGSGQPETLALESSEAITQMLKLLSEKHTDNYTIQTNILNTMLGIGMGNLPEAAQVQKRMRQAGFVRESMTFLETSGKLRNSAMQVLWMLAEHGGKEVADGLKSQQRMKLIVDALDPNRPLEERAAASGILADLPVNDDQVTRVMLEVQALDPLYRMCVDGMDFLRQGGFQSSRLVLEPYQGGQLILGRLWIRTRGTDRSAAIRMVILENALGVFQRFTRPQNQALQLRVVEMGLVNTLRVLLSAGSDLSRAHAAKVIGNLSAGAAALSREIKPGKRCCFFMTTVVEEECRLHGGVCDADHPLCMIKAGILKSVVNLLNEKTPTLVEAGLQALSTVLITNHRNGSQRAARILVEEEAIPPIVHILMHGSPLAREKAVCLLEVVFRVSEFMEEYRALAHPSLIEVIKDGTMAAKETAAKALSHMGALHPQSAYFTA